MAKNANIFWIVCCCIWCCSGCLPKDEITTDTTVVSQPAQVIEIHKSYEELCKEVQKVYTSQDGITERTGHNDGPGPKRYLAAVGLPEGNPYCAAGVAWTFKQVGIKTTITGYSPTAVNYKDLVYSMHKLQQVPHTGDVITFYYPNIKRIGHTGFLDHMTSEDTYVSFEFNTSGGPGVNRDGGGAYFMKRSLNMTYIISNWIPK